MNCRGAHRRLSAYLDNALSKGIRQSVEDHLKGCSSCRHKLAELEIIKKTTQDLPRLKVSNGFTEKVIQSTLNDKSKEGLSNYGYKFVLASTSFVIAAVLIFLIVNPAQEKMMVPNPTLANSENLQENQTELSDLANDPTIKVNSVPIPPDIRNRDMIIDDSLILADSSSKIDEFLLPEVDEVRENVNIKF